MKRQYIGLAVLALAVFCSALGVVYTEHENRKLFAELQALQNKQDHMDVEWGRLQLEQSTWATHGRVEEVARTRLGMLLPAPEDIVIVRP